MQELNIGLYYKRSKICPMDTYKFIRGKFQGFTEKMWKPANITGFLVTKR